MASDSNTSDKQQPNVPKQNAISDLIAKFPRLNDMGLLIVRQREISDRQVHDSNIKNAPEEILKPIAKVIRKYTSRYSDPTWPAGMPELLKASTQAERSLGLLIDSMKNMRLGVLLEIEDRMRLQLRLAGQPIPNSFERSNVKGQLKLIKEIAQLHVRTVLYNRVLPSMIATHEKRKTKTGMENWGTAKYLEPALELIALWRRLANAPVVFAKQNTAKMKDKAKQKIKAKQETKATQSQTEFVKWGLLMIDNKLTELEARQKAGTAIISALKIEKEIGDALRKQMKKLQNDESDGGKGPFDLFAEEHN